MTGAVARALFARPRSSASDAFPPRALVMGTERDAPALAAALAGELRARRRCGAALLVACSASPEWALPLVATRAARALAARLDRRGLPAVARGRLAWLVPGARRDAQPPVPPDGAESGRIGARDRAGARAELGRGEVSRASLADSLGVALRAAAAVDVPAVVAVCGPRPPEADRVLAEFDLIVLAGDELGAAEFAAAELGAEGVGALVCDPRRDAARLLALGGWGRLRAGGVAPLAAELA